MPGENQCRTPPRSSSVAAQATSKGPWSARSSPGPRTISFAVSMSKATRRPLAREGPGSSTEVSMEERPCSPAQMARILGFFPGIERAAAQAGDRALPELVLDGTAPARRDAQADAVVVAERQL